MRKHRRLTLERLEDRLACSGLVEPLYCGAELRDVDGQGPVNAVTPGDVLALVNALNLDPEQLAQLRQSKPLGWGDVSCDGRITPLDPLKLINEHNQYGSLPAAFPISGWNQVSTEVPTLVQTSLGKLAYAVPSGLTVEVQVVLVFQVTHPDGSGHTAGFNIFSPEIRDEATGNLFSGPTVVGSPRIVRQLLFTGQLSETGLLDVSALLGAGLAEDTIEVHAMWTGWDATVQRPTNALESSGDIAIRCAMPGKTTTSCDLQSDGT
jgi:hypothetical protein